MVLHIHGFQMHGRQADELVHRTRCHCSSTFLRVRLLRPVPEIAQRVAPKFSTLRDLFVHSGNKCAFPDCDRVLVNHKGQWVGEVCHIQATLPGGERFNPEMTNDERRHRSNLVLLCHEHHVETDDVDEFTVERMRQIKTDHEARFAGPPPMSDEVLERAVQDIMAASIEDQTDRVVLHLPQTLASFSEVMGHTNTDEERRGTIEMLQPTLRALRRLPVDTRAVFAILADRTPAGDSVGLPVHEIELATGTAPDGLAPHIEMLERYRLAALEEEWLDDRPSYWSLGAFDVDGWDFWRDFRGTARSVVFAPRTSSATSVSTCSTSGSGSRSNSRGIQLRADLAWDEKQRPATRACAATSRPAVRARVRRSPREAAHSSFLGRLTRPLARHGVGAAAGTRIAKGLEPG